METELQALEINKTWSVVPLLPRKHTVGCRWTYKIKYKQDGSIHRQRQDWS